MKTRHDWSAVDALTEEQVHAAALADPDAQPLTEERLAKMRRVPRTKSIRRALGVGTCAIGTGPLRTGCGGARLPHRYRPRAGYGSPRIGAASRAGLTAPGCGAFAAVSPQAVTRRRQFPAKALLPIVTPARCRPSWRSRCGQLPKQAVSGYSFAHRGGGVRHDAGRDDCAVSGVRGEAR